MSIKYFNLYRLKLKDNDGEIFNQNIVALSPQSVLDYYYKEFNEHWTWFGLDWLGTINEVLDYEEEEG